MDGSYKTADTCLPRHKPGVGPASSGKTGTGSYFTWMFGQNKGGMPNKSLLKQSAISCALTSVVPKGYGLVTLTALGSILLVTWKAMKVAAARSEYKVPYPQMYSTECMPFNCVQRAHQNTLENYPQFLLLLMIGGLEMPYFCTLGGWIWILGRLCYAKGYYTGDPGKRAKGTFSMIGMVMLFAATAKFAIKSIS